MTIYHTFMFGILLIGVASFVFQASENERLLSKETVPLKNLDSKFDLNTY